MSEHTEGKLRVSHERRNAIVNDGPKQAIVANCEYTHSTYRGRAKPTGEESIANARRLVACWNACEGISDPEAYIEHARTLVRDVPKLEAHDSKMARDLAEHKRRLGEILECVDGLEDIDNNGGPNLAMRIGQIARGEDRP